MEKIENTPKQKGIYFPMLLAIELFFIKLFKINPPLKPIETTTTSPFWPPSLL